MSAFCPNKALAEQLLTQYGSPLYVYEAETMLAQLQSFRDGFAGLPIKVHYAAKALTNLNVLALFQQAGTGLDTVSLAEVEMGLMVGFAPNDIVFTPNCVDFSEIEIAVEKGVRINIENLPNLAAFGERFGGNYACCIRLHPDIQATEQSEKIAAWHRQSKFGIARTQMATVHELKEKYNLQIEGIHLHSSSKIMNPEVFREGVKTVMDLALAFPDLRYLDFGGGIRVNYQEEEAPINLEALGDEMRPLYADFVERYGRELEIWFEPGRYLVGPAGVLLSKVALRKNNGHIEIIGLDTGFNHLIRPMMYDAYHQIVNLSRSAGPEQKYNVVGNICEIDNFAVQRTMPECKSGDIVAIMHAGAYGFSMASQYNSRYRPAEVLIEQNQSRLIRKRDRFENLINQQVWDKKAENSMSEHSE
ncbi:MAG: diaminopimelate decarboxylase [Bacteroidia bacterium]